MMIQCPYHYALVQGAGDQPCKSPDCVLRHDACPRSRREGVVSSGPSWCRRGGSIVPGGLCHLLHPCSNRSVDVTSEGMYWTDKSGAYAAVKEDGI
eukprot:1042541-Alexandrium_andersonii.AAC.1